MNKRNNERTNAFRVAVWTPIRYVTLHLRVRVGAASLRYRNRAEITVLMWEQKPYPVWTDGRTDGRTKEPILFVWQCEHLSDMWLFTLQLGTSSFATLQKSRRNHRSYVRTEALLGMDGRTDERTKERMLFVWQCEHLSDMWLFTLELGTAQLRPVTEIALKSPFLCEKRRVID